MRGSCPYTRASAWLGQGLEQKPPHVPGSPPPFHLLDGSFQAAHADAELEPPQEVIRCGDQDMQLFVHEAIEGSGFSQMAPGRQWR